MATQKRANQRKTSRTTAVASSRNQSAAKTSLVGQRAPGASSDATRHSVTTSLGATAPTLAPVSAPAQPVSSSAQVYHLRALFSDKVSQSPVAGLRIIAAAQTFSGRVVPLGLLDTDDSGYVSYYMSALANTSDVAQIWIAPLSDPSSLLKNPSP